MPRFFCSTTDIENECIHIHGEDAQHISRVLRMRVGESVIACDCEGNDYDCEVAELGDTVLLNIIGKHKNETEPQLYITLYQCLPKGDKLEFTIQKAVELGCSRIVPVVSRYCVAKADAASFEKKRLRLQKIATEAAKQSGRGKLPEVAPLLTFEEAVREATSASTALFCYEGGGEKISDILPCDVESVSIMVGSEGGFSQEEAAAAINAGMVSVSLGKLILRCETAPIVGITLIRSAFGDM